MILKKCLSFGWRKIIRKRGSNLSNKKSKYLTSGQSATILGVGSSTVRRWIDQGLFDTFVTVGGHNRLLESDVLDFKSSREKIKDEGVRRRDTD